MKLAELHEVFLEALCLHELLRRLNFTADEIFVAYGRIANPATAIFSKGLKVGAPAFFVTLKAQGKEYNVAIGAAPVGKNEIKQAWDAAVAVYNGATRAETDPLWARSLIVKRSATVVIDLVGLGYVLPKLEN